METGTENLLFERRGPVAWVTFNRPEARNAMTWAMYDALVRVCDYVTEHDDIRVLVLTGAGEKAFVAGTDIGQFRAFKEPKDALDYEEQMDAVVTKLETLARPTIAAIRGYAVGGGVSLAMSCDLRICTPDARFGVPIARTLGNCLSMNTYAKIVDLIGPALAKEMLFLAKLFTAEEAKASGLVNEIVEPDALLPRAQAIAEQIASNAPLTIRVTKEAIRRVLMYRRPPRSEDLILTAYMSEDFQEGVSAFLEKRKPQWQGK